MKTKQNKKLTVILLIAVMVVMYGFIPKPDNLGAVDAITDAADLISDSDLGVTGVTHTLTFTTGTTTEQYGFWRFEFPWQVTNFGGGAETCAYGDLTADVDAANRIVDCRSDAGATNATTTEFVITALGNATTTGEYTVDITLYDSSTTSLERVQVMYAIIDDVLVTATIDSTLDFNVFGTSTGSVNGVACDNASTPTTIPFGTLSINATTTVCQRLTVATNADDGYTVTVWQDNELRSDSGSYINSFFNTGTGTGTTTAEVWKDPLNILDVEYTYGHMGLTSNDTDLNTVYPDQDYYNGGTTQYAGLNSSDPLPIMHHSGPSDGSTANIGNTSIAYSVQIASLQEAGDYESTLTYICTPTY